jgi:superoxide dismutase
MYIKSYDSWVEGRSVTQFDSPVTSAPNHYLPPLPYPYDGLEPVISRDTMRSDYGQIHFAEVINLKTVLERHPEADLDSIEELLVNINYVPEDILRYVPRLLP